MLRVLVHNSISEIAQAEWARVAGTAPVSQVFQSYGWHQACLSSLDGNARPFLLSVLDGERRIAILPFMITSTVKGRVMAFIGDGRSDYADLLYTGAVEPVIATLLAFLHQERARWDELQLNNVPEASPMLKCLPGLANVVGFWHLPGPELPCPSLILRDGAAQALSKESLRRHRKQLEGMGLEVRHLTAASDIEPWLDTFFEQHIERWASAGSGGQSLFKEHRHRMLYRHVVEQGVLPGEVVFTVLLVNGKPCAFHFGFIDGKKLLWYKPSFDVRLARHSPGEVLLGELIVLAQARGLEELDFTRGAEAFKARFATTVRRNVSCTVGHGRGRRLIRLGWDLLRGRRT